jgi:phosphoserine phosphatase RsbU/P
MLRYIEAMRRVGICLRVSGFLLAALACAAIARAQGPTADPRGVDATNFGERIELGPLWLFQVGDNPAWAAPEFDDANWQVISAKKQLIDYGIRNIPFGWYRMHIHLRPGAPIPAVAIASVLGTSEVFANGIHIGGSGPIPGPAYRFQYRLLAYPIPKTAISSDGDLVLAIRFAVNPAGRQIRSHGRKTATPIGFESHVFLMSPVQATINATYINAHATWPLFLLAGLSFLTGVIALGLYLALRTQKEYLAAAAALFTYCALFLSDIWLQYGDRTPLSDWIDYALFGLAQGLILEFFRILLAPFLGSKRPRWLLVVQIVIVLSALMGPLVNYGLPGTFELGLITFFLPTLVVEALILVLLFVSGRAGSVEARILGPAVLAVTFSRGWLFARYLIIFLNQPFALPALPSLQLGSFAISFDNICDLIFFTCILLFLVFRTVGIARHDAESAAELEAGRSMQQWLLSRSQDATPGFALEIEYHPAKEVGGDFFFISSGRDGSLLATVGDVSGKGIQAAMRVAGILGSLKREDSRDPAIVLANLNLELLGQTEIGFTTACCIHIDRSGAYTLANAGHIPPYLAGKEVATPPALPLGVAAAAEYQTVPGRIAPGETLVLISDGVVEAQSPSGELFGFERTAALASSNSSEQIAYAAKAFGQEDDITVLSIALAS